MDTATLGRVYRRLLAHHGPQGWWPADTPFEVMIGAILTQNTAWSNVERALARLRTHGPLSAHAILALPPETLAEALRPSGYYTLKAQRVRAFSQAYVEAGEWEALARLDTQRLRAWLLAVKGIGPETADDILLYGFERAVFVVDAYTRRLFSRLGLLCADASDASIRLAVEAGMGPDVEVLKEYHALIVAQGKTYCRARPHCEGCALRSDCRFAAGAPRPLYRADAASSAPGAGTLQSEETP